MNKHQREGLAAVWGFYRIILLAMAALAVIAGIGFLVYRISGSPMWAAIIAICIMIGGIYGYITVDTYRTAVRRSRSEELSEIERQARKLQFEQETERELARLERTKKMLGKKDE
jgi:hypothetical protein